MANPYKQSVIATIHQDLDLYNDLHGLLEQQQAFILNRDHQGLAESAKAITSVMLNARENRAKRSQAMQQIGLINSRSGMESFLEQLVATEKQEVTEDWQELMELVEECKAINQINDQALKLQNEAAEKILSQLPVQGSNSKTYSSTGVEQPSSRSILNTQA
ncbi:hypothetical protein GZ77_06135 [Endozoicomonas montiporae]|uniref:Flagellar biosynthesis protein FlgN n=2 Tax=Endozoicomonas montiporae TaxID=1027273 RepID=A0A081NC68_9GAMM|nr:flagellar protein FlgN [Endozoicomonas montiporae]KEQ16041.1 hypothetical protein GZ77_06135 [Endozoicomonas montiporae]